jgi:hypothetical protein
MNDESTTCIDDLDPLELIRRHANVWRRAREWGRQKPTDDWRQARSGSDAAHSSAPSIDTDVDDDRRRE